MNTRIAKHWTYSGNNKQHAHSKKKPFKQRSFVNTCRVSKQEGGAAASRLLAVLEHWGKKKKMHHPNGQEELPDTIFKFAERPLEGATASCRIELFLS